MFKNLAIAVLLAIILSYSMGSIAHEWFDLHLVVDDHIMDPLGSFVVAAVVGIVLAIVGFCIALSLFGVLAFVVAVVFFGILIAGIGAFWPVLLVGAILYYLLKDKQSPQY